MALGTMAMFDPNGRALCTWSSTLARAASVRPPAVARAALPGGVCVACHTPIERERLRALPGVTHCGGCTRRSPV